MFQLLLTKLFTQMKNYLTFSIVLACSFSLIITSCSDDDNNPAEKKATAIIGAKNDSGISGTVTFTEVNGVVTMNAEVSNVTAAGDHAIHIHETGDCSANDGTSAGGHWNPTNVDHGEWGTAPFHIGDIGNIVVDANGNGTIVRQTNLWCIGCDDQNKNILNKAIIIHEGPDDFSSQPSGAAGPRIGCGEIIQD